MMHGVIHGVMHGGMHGAMHGVLHYVMPRQLKGGDGVDGDGSTM